MPAVPQYLDWSEAPITWDRSDHPPVVYRPGRYALVVAPIVDNFRLQKVLMDGGSSINLLYLDTLKRMNLSETQLSHSKISFHGIIPGKQAVSMGKITLEVIFGPENNYRSEYICFEVVPFKSTYHAVFGRPAFAKFMARPCYVYNKLKMPGPKGTITICGDIKKAAECEKGNAALHESVLYAQELEDLKKDFNPKEMPTSKIKTADQKTSFKASQETKKFDLVEGNSLQQAIISAHLDNK